MFKYCIWCNKANDGSSFHNKAHIVPKSLGGRFLNNNVCNECNSYFGNKPKGTPFSVEEALKEGLYLWQYVQLKSIGQWKNPFKSAFFELKHRKGSPRLKVKDRYKFNNELQVTLGRSFKRGMYKIFFEEFDRSCGSDKLPNADRIVRFVRHDEGDIPLFYFERKVPIIMATPQDVRHPRLYLNESERMKYVIHTDHFWEFELLGQVFGVQYKDCNADEYKRYEEASMKAKQRFFGGIREVNSFQDIDYAVRLFAKKW